MMFFRALMPERYQTGGDLRVTNNENADNKRPGRKTVLIVLILCLAALFQFRRQTFEALSAISGRVGVRSALAEDMSGLDFEVSHECDYLDPKATQCWSHLKIVSLNDGPVTIKEVIVNGRKECTPETNGLVLLLASRLINVSKMTIQKGDAYGVGIACEPVDAEIVTDRGTWTGGKGR
jgi:hypothetical protein